MKNPILFIVAIVIASSSGFALQRYLDHKQIQIPVENNPAIGNQRPEFAAMDLDDQLRNIKEWDGKLILLNFWATWCPPCKKEIPDFIELQQEYGDQGFQIIGIAIDNKEAIAEYAERMGINYPTLLAEIEGVGLAKRFGNGIGVLPYTVIIDRKGEISYTIKGELSKIQAEDLLQKHGINL